MVFETQSSESSKPKAMNAMSWALMLIIVLGVSAGYTFYPKPASPEEAMTYIEGGDAYIEYATLCKKHPEAAGPYARERHLHVRSCGVAELPPPEPDTVAVETPEAVKETEGGNGLSQP